MTMVRSTRLIPAMSGRASPCEPLTVISHRLMIKTASSHRGEAGLCLRQHRGQLPLETSSATALSSRKGYLRWGSQDPQPDTIAVLGKLTPI